MALLLTLLLANCGGVQVETQPNAEPELLPKATHSLRIDDPIVVPQAYSAHLWLDPNESDFRGEVKIDLQVMKHASEFYLNGHGLKIETAILVDSKGEHKLKVEAEDKEWLHFESINPLLLGAATLQINYTGAIDEKDSYGIFRQKAGEDWYLFTQFESRGARRAFPSYDQPDLKVPWTLSISAPSDLVALANTPELARKNEAEGTTRVDFATSKKLPSYLVAFAVGPFDMVDIGTTRSGAKVRVAAPKGRGNETSWVQDSTLRLIEILEDYTAVAYPYAKLDLVSIPATGSFGAMENPGLITYTETLLLSTTNDLDFRKAYASVGAHELAHQWFGNLVTNAWWNDIWLNESFATWAEAKTMEVFEPSWRADLAWIELREDAMGADALHSARVIRQPIVKDGDIAAAFDGITYAKGASILTMIEGFVGKEMFQKGIRAYLTLNSWKSIRAEDFLAAMDATVGTKVSPTFLSFIGQAGTPSISMELACTKDAIPQLSLRQERYAPVGSSIDKAQTYAVPLCVSFSLGKESQTQCMTMAEAEDSIALGKTPGCPEWLIPNAGATGYYRSSLSAPLRAALTSAPLSPAEKMVMALDLHAQVNAGVVPMSELLETITRLARSEDEALVLAAAELANFPHLVEAPLKGKYQRFLAKNFARKARKLSWKTAESDTPIRRELRSALLHLMATHGNDGYLRRAGEKIAAKALAAPKSVEADTLAAALEVGAFLADEARVQTYIAAIKNSASKSFRRKLFAALGQISDPDRIAQALTLMLDDEIDPRESQRMLTAMATNSEHGHLSLSFVVEHWEILEKRFGKYMAKRIARVASAQCRQADRPQVEKFLNEKIRPMDAGERTANKALEKFELCVAQKALLAPSLPALL